MELNCIDEIFELEVENDHGNLHDFFQIFPIKGLDCRPQKLGFFDIFGYLC
jgi:hypothetical protein